MIVFAGPSLSGADISGYGGVEILPPVRQGDVYLAALEQPSAIGIIDGYFDGVPSVWHKEILWAISEGIPVIGAASMGALRAAELEMFGMIGIGAIYDGYRLGHLEDDDEVALVHRPEELGYVALSVAMVNVRATCEAAAAAGAISAAEAETLIAVAKAQFYKTRTWDSILHASDPGMFSGDDLERLDLWIGAHKVDQKKEDALALLDCMTRGNFHSAAPDFHFEQTDLWVQQTEIWRRSRKRDRGTPGTGYRLLGSIDLLQ